MKYDFNRLIQTTLPSNPNLSGQDAANYNLRILEFSNCYTSNMHCIKEDLKSFMREMKQTTQLKKFSFNQKKHLFEHIQKEGTSLQKGFCYLTGYGTKANIEEAEKYLAQSDEGKLLMAKAYILGKGVPRDFNMAFEVYPDPKNPLGNFMIYKNGTCVTVRELLFDDSN